VNLILFSAEEVLQPLPRSDPRAVHLIEVLRRRPGDTFDCGLVNGPRGKGRLLAINADALQLAFQWGEPPPPAVSLTLLVGLPRPQTARDILRDATTLGVAALHFVLTEKSDPGYARSTLWTSDEWRRHLITGAEQAFDTRIPNVSHGRLLAEELAALPSGGTRLALDHYEAVQSLSTSNVTPDQPATLALGPERGWGAADRALLRGHGFTLVHLGSRVLRTETAVVTAIAFVRAKLGLM
jgi:16S rRNA (uracil1498-N3)-methyltransferase